MNKTYKIQLPRNKEAYNVKANIKNGTIDVEVKLKEKLVLKSGDIFYAEAKDLDNWKFILIYGDSEHPGIFKCKDNDWSFYNFNPDWGYVIIRLATDSEKQLLFDALAKEGKMWDAEKKAVVDLPRWR